MARALRIQYPGACYHVTCRGNERKNIYQDSEDKRIFKSKLKVSQEIYSVEVLSYVLMSNHFHLLIHTPHGNLSEFMRHFNISYTSAYNRRHKRCGHLYQGRYKAFLIDADNYLLAVSRYIHLNPIRTDKYVGVTPEEQWAVLQKYADSSLAGYCRESEKVIKGFVEITGKQTEELLQRGRCVAERALLMEVLSRCCDITQPDIGRLFGGVDYSAVSQARKRLREKMANDENLKWKYDKIIEQLMGMSG